MTHTDRQPGRLAALHADLQAGRISRRQFLTAALALGVALPVAQFIAGATGVAAQDAATPVAVAPGSGRPDSGTQGQTRGAGGELKVLEWQAPTNLSVHGASGGADISAASLVTEPLLSYAQDGTLLPALAAEVPTVDNGGLSADLTVITYKLLPNVLWSDGQPFTADDVVFTWQWIVNPDNKSVDATTFGIISNIEAVDPLTAKVTLTAPSLGWYVPFTSSNRGGIYPKHFWDGVDRETANSAFSAKPIGTGPFVVDSFTPNDQAIYLANENYREPNKPFFAKVNYKGGGDAPTAAAAVLQTGDWDFADNTQVDPGILRQMEKAGHGKITVPRAPRSRKSRSTSPTRIRRSMGRNPKRTRRTRSSPTPRCGRRSRWLPTGRRSASSSTRDRRWSRRPQHPHRHRRLRIAEHQLGVQSRQGQANTRCRRLGAGRRHP